MKIIKLATLAATVASLLILTGCGTIFGDNTRAIKVSSIPSEAGIYVDNQQVGVTPAVVTLPTYIYGGKAVTVRKKGYTDQTAMANSKFQPISLLDIFLWPTFFIDAATGSLVKIDPANLDLNLRLQRA